MERNLVMEIKNRLIQTFVINDIDIISVENVSDYRDSIAQGMKY